MTKIVFQPANLPAAQGDAVILPPPWRWWETRAYENRDTGNVSEQQILPDLDAPREYWLTFGDDWDRVVLTNPPSMISVYVEHYDVGWSDPLRTVLPRRSFMTVRVVWHECPGPRWHQVPGLIDACVPGDYRFEHQAHEGRSWTHFSEDIRMPRWRGYVDLHRVLRWPTIPTIRDGRPMPPEAEQQFPLALVDRCDQCQRFMPLPEIGRSLTRLPGGLCDQCHSLRSGALTVNEIRAREGLAELPDHDYIWQPVAYPADPPRDLYANTPSRSIVPSSPINTEACRPEQHVLDEIEALVNDQLQQEASGYEHLVGQDYCHLCGGLWHGLTGEGGKDQMGNRLGRRGCPGAFATEDEEKAWHARGRS